MVQREQIAIAADKIRPYIRGTPVLEVPAGTFGVDATLVFKLEHLQTSGSFKVRGAATAVLTYPKAAEAGLVAASGGNHGVAVATVAQRLGVKAKVFVPSVSGAAKRKRIRDLGGDVVVEGDVYAQALEAAAAEAESNGMLIVHPFESPEAVIGGGTLGPELEQQAEPDMVAVAVGGGGLAAGIATWFGGGCSLVCAEPVGSPTLNSALNAGRPVDIEIDGIAADALGCPRIGDISFEVLSRSRVESCVVSESEVIRAQHDLWDVLRLAVEPAAAVAFAGVRALPPKAVRAKRIAVLLCGANMDPAGLSSGAVLQSEPVDLVR